MNSMTIDLTEPLQRSCLYCNETFELKGQFVPTEKAFDFNLQVSRHVQKCRGINGGLNEAGRFYRKVA